MSGERESPVECEEAKNNGVVCGYVLCVYVCVSVCVCVLAREEFLVPDRIICHSSVFIPLM